MSRLRLAKISTPSVPPPNAAELFYSLADAKLEAIDENGKVAVLGGFASADYRLIRVLVITASGTYTPTPGTRALYVECLGGGGGGGGCPATTSNASAAGGGSSGAYAAGFLSPAATSYSVTVGAGGAGGTSGGAGGNGGDTSLGSILAKGGVGGSGGTTPGTATGVSGGGNIQTGSTGDLVASGGIGFPGVVVSGTLACAGMGGISPATFLSNYSAAGSSGIAFMWIAGSAQSTIRAPGAGGANLGTQAAFNGVVGLQGGIRVWEFA